MWVLYFVRLDSNLKYSDEIDAYTSYKSQGHFTPHPGNTKYDLNNLKNSYSCCVCVPGHYRVMSISTYQLFPPTSCSACLVNKCISSNLSVELSLQMLILLPMPRPVVRRRRLPQSVRPPPLHSQASMASAAPSCTRPRTSRRSNTSPLSRRYLLMVSCCFVL